MGAHSTNNTFKYEALRIELAKAFRQALIEMGDDAKKLSWFNEQATTASRKAA